MGFLKLCTNFNKSEVQLLLLLLEDMYLVFGAHLMARCEVKIQAECC